MDARTAFVLRSDVSLLPVSEVKESIRVELSCGPDDFVISQISGRGPATLVDGETAGLLRGFEKAQTVAEAIIEYSLPRGLEPEEVLEEALPLIERFFRRGLLIDADDAEAEAASRQSFKSGERIDDLTVLRPLQILDDCELYQVKHGPDFAALKLHRADASGFLDHEASVLKQLSGRIAPHPLRRGQISGRPYLLMEWCHGIDLHSAGAEWRGESSSDSRGQLLKLCRRVTRVYARLHSFDVIHGDVHPRNLLVDRAGIKLVDFVNARGLSLPLSDAPVHRPGVPFYFEPEHARAMLAGRPAVPVSEAGEQFAVGALLYRLVTGVHYCDFGLEQRDLFRRITEAQPVPFHERGISPWPELEAILSRALAQQPTDRFSSMAALADALDALPEPTVLRLAQRTPAQAARHQLRHTSRELIGRAELDGPWLKDGLDIAPNASLTYGAAGIAHALYRIACQRDLPEKLALADVWARRAESAVDLTEGFYNDSKGLAAEDLGLISPYHTPTGVFVVSAIIARARNDSISLKAAIEAFVAASEKPTSEVDLTLGTSGILLACALLENLRSSIESLDMPTLSELGHRSLQDIWCRLDTRPPISEIAGEPLGMAHGWAGFLYASLQWCRASGAEYPEGLEARLDELADLATPVGRGLRFIPRRPEPRSQVPSGWCQGSAGQVFLWTLAARLLNDGTYDELAVGAAWDAWDGLELASSLCCGLAGRTYAMLCMYKHTDEQLWLDRAHDLALRAAREHRFESDFPHSLYKGELILAVLAADLERPEDAAMPFFEPEGW